MTFFPLRPASWEELADRQTMVEVVHHYAWAFDDRRLDVLREVFTEDVVFTYVVGAGVPVRTHGKESVVAMLAASMDPECRTRHLLAGTRSARYDETAGAVVTTGLVVQPEKKFAATSTSRYTMSLRFSEGQWRISEVLNQIDSPHEKELT